MANSEEQEVRKRKNCELKSNPVAKNLRSSKFSQKVVQLKKLDNRKKDKLNTYKAAAKKENI